jgi:UDP-N-acetyl-D-glucosamine dehydrogenase
MDTRFIELAGEVNHSMPDYVVSRLTEALNDRGKSLKDAAVLILGVAYKRDIDDDRESPAFRLMELLERRRAVLSYHDPYVPRLRPSRRYDFGLESVPLTPENLAAADAVVIVTDHGDVDYAAVVEHAQLVVDTRNATRHVDRKAGNVVLA